MNFRLLKLLCLVFVLGQAAGSETWTHHQWEGQYWGEPARLDDWSSPSGYRRRLSLQSVPWSEWGVLEHATFSAYEIGRNGHRRDLRDGNRLGLVARWLLDSGLWQKKKDFKELEVEADSSGRPLRAVFAGCRREWDYAKGVAYREEYPGEGLSKATHFRLTSSDAQEPPPLPERLRPAARSYERPLILENGYTLIEVDLDGQPETFLLDTGASHNIIDRNLVARRRWPRAGHQSNPSGLLLKSMGWAQLPEVRIGGLSLPQQIWLELDLEGSPLHNILPKVRGILGYEFLSDYIVQWDYPRSRLKLISGEYQPASDDQEVQARRETGGLSVQASVQGQPGWFLVDTGNYSGVIVHHLPGQRDWVPPSCQALYDPKGLLYGSGSAGTWPGRGSFQLGPFRWSGAPLEIVDEKSAQGGLLEHDGNLGVELWKHFCLTADLARGKLWLAQKKPFQAPRRATFGLRFRVDGGRWRVNSLPLGGPAARAGVSIGDELISIQGAPPQGLATTTLLKQARAGQELQLVLKREEKVLKFLLRARAID